MPLELIGSISTLIPSDYEFKVNDNYQLTLSKIHWHQIHTKDLPLTVKSCFFHLAEPECDFELFLNDPTCKAQLFVDHNNYGGANVYIQCTGNVRNSIDSCGCKLYCNQMLGKVKQDCLKFVQKCKGWQGNQEFNFETLWKSLNFKEKMEESCCERTYII